MGHGIKERIGHLILFKHIWSGSDSAYVRTSALVEALSFAVANDKASIKAYKQSGKCFFPLKGGLNVTITDVGFSVHEFVFQGTKLYAPAEALMRR